MKHALFLSGLLLLVLGSLASSCQKKKEAIILLENDITLEREDEPVSISRDNIERHLGTIPEGMIPAIVDEDGNFIPSQMDDLTGNGEWDELFFLSSIPPNKMITRKLKLIPSEDSPSFKPRTNIRFAEITDDGNFISQSKARRLKADDPPSTEMFQHEGPAWENEFVGFRNYFNSRNSMDIFGKVTSNMVLDSAGIGEDYHFMQYWGMDILMVGNSLGAGALAFEKDSVFHRVAPGAKGTFELISEGPLRSVLRLRYDQWLVGGNEYSLIHDISIYGGAWYYESTVYIEGMKSDETLISGITTIELEEKDPIILKNDKGVSTFATHGQQAYNDGEYLGMAIMVGENSYKGYEYIGTDGEDIENTYLVKMRWDDDKPVKFRFYSNWELTNEQFSDRTYFRDFLEHEAAGMAYPVKISIK